MSKEELLYIALEKENQFMKENIKKLHNVIENKDRELQSIKESKGYKFLEKLRSIKRRLIKNGKKKNSPCN